MNYADVRGALGSPELGSSEIFQILRSISQHVNNKETHALGRDLVIRALARVDLCGDFEKKILMSLVRNVGLYPYMSELIDVVLDDDLLAYEMHRPEGMPEVFHSLQARIYYQLLSGSNVVLSASTSAGKSLIIDAIIATRKFKKVVIVVPTLALIDETRKRLSGRFRGEAHVITHQTQVIDPEKINIYVLTQERVKHRIDLTNVDFFVVDEFYKLDLRSDDDVRRAVDLNLAFHQLASTGAQFYLLGPNVQAIRGLDKYEIHFIPSEFSTVAVDATNFNLPMRGFERVDKLVELCRTLDGPTLIYCQSPTSAVRVAGYLVNKVATEIAGGAVPLADWMSDNFHPEWVAASALRRGVGLHHGGIPRSLQQQMVRLFNERVIKYLICTSTLIEGVNTVAESVIVYDRRRNNNVLDFFTYKNIEGRAGRMGHYFVGKVFSLESPPEVEDVVVEYPIGQQDMNTPMSLLLQLDDSALTDLSRERIADELAGGFLSADTIRLNSSVPAEVQNMIADEMLSDVEVTKELYSWQGFPKQRQLVAVCDIIEKYLSGEMLKNYGISSGAQLAWHLSALGHSGNIKEYLEQNVNGLRPGQTVSAKIDEALKIMRNVISYRFPQDLMVIHNIQLEVCSHFEIQSGDYSVYAEAAENLFVPGVLGALEEYGVPLQIIQRIAPSLQPSFDLDTAINRLRSLDVASLDLTSFERSLLTSVQESL